MSKKPSQLHEVLAVLRDAETQANKIMEETQNVFSKKPQHFRGMTKTTKMFDEERANENLTDTNEIVTTVQSKLDHMSKSVIRHYDAVLQMEATNQHAVADLEIDGVVIAKDLPSTFLLGLETRLVGLRKVFEAIPTLDPGMKWEHDPASDHADCFTAEVETLKTEKKIEVITLAHATEHHPAQVKERSLDAPCAKITTTHKTTMWTPLRKSQLLDRVDKLIRATKKSRQRANSVELKKVKAGTDIFKYLFTDSSTE